MAKSKKAAPRVLAYPAYPSGGNQQLVGNAANKPVTVPRKTSKKGKR